MALIVVIGAGPLLLASISFADVRREARALGGGAASVKLEGWALSGSHVMWFEYSVSGVPELNKAYWRLVPIRSVEFTK